MLFSGKITHSIVQYLDRVGVDQDRLYDLTELPTEYLRDPSCWIDAQDVENFLKSVDLAFSEFAPDQSVIVHAGHLCAELRAWGVLDSVLRMMQRPEDIFSQPHRFLSYFVSPAPPIANLQVESEGAAFDLPISNQEFPHVTEYLRAALESLPKFLGQEPAHVRWRQTKISISWSRQQAHFLPDTDLEPQYKPEFVQGLLRSLEETQRKVEELNSLLLERERKIQSLGSLDGREPEGLSLALLQSFRVYVTKSRGQLMRLGDYMTRAHQLVTLLVGQNRMDRQVQEAMRRVDWDYVKGQYQSVIQETADLMSSFEKEVQRGISEKQSKRPPSRHLELPL